MVPTHFKDGLTHKARPTNLPDLGDGKKMMKNISCIGEVDEPGMKTLNPIVREPVFSITGVPDVVRPEAEMSHLNLNSIVTASQENQTRYGVAINEIRLRQDVLDVKTTNGILLWKIPDIRRHFWDSVWTVAQ